MRYGDIVFGTFVERLNRFVARVAVEGAGVEPLAVHVKNTGRCTNLLLPGARVVLERAANPARSTAYDLIGAYAPDGRLFNIDSQAPNRAVGEWLAGQGFDLVRPEYPFGRSRVDFYMERVERGGSAVHAAPPGPDGERGDTRRFLLEVKGCTLTAPDGRTGLFPDAPTARGVKHLRELAGAVGRGYSCAVAFVMPAAGMDAVLPHAAVDPVFARAYEEAEAAGVRMLSLPCSVAPGELCVAKGVCFDPQN